VLQCKEGDGPSCLTAPQVAATKQIYSNAINPRTRKELFASFVPGSELGWGIQAAGPEAVGRHLRPVSLRRVQGSELGLEDVRLRQGRREGRPAGEPDHERHDPNMQTFFSRGGKLILYHGWSDSQVPP
jgi:feruloyl esterase